VLRHPTIEKLQALKLLGMATALAEHGQLPDLQALSFEERLGLLVDRELTAREDRRLARRLVQARLPLPAAVEDLDYRPGRGLDNVKTEVGCPQNTDLRCPLFTDEIVQSFGSDRHIRRTLSGLGGRPAAEESRLLLLAEPIALALDV
jgi:hypothetical protein